MMYGRPTESWAVDLRHIWSTNNQHTLLYNTELRKCDLNVEHPPFVELALASGL